MGFLKDWKLKRKITKRNRELYEKWQIVGLSGGKLPEKVTHPAARAGFKAGRKAIETSKHETGMLGKFLNYSGKVSDNLAKSGFEGDFTVFGGSSSKSKKKKKRKKRRPKKRVVEYY